MNMVNVIHLVFFICIITSLSFPIYAQSIDSILNEANNLIQSGNDSKALSLLLNAFDKHPESWSIPYIIGIIFFDKEIYNLSLKYFKIAEKRGEASSQLHYYMGECYGYLNDNKKAAYFFKKALDISFDPYNLYSLIWTLLRMKKFDEAIAYLNIGKQQYPNHSYFSGANALYNANQRNIEKARYYYQESIKKQINPSGIYYYNWGVMELNIRNFAAAENLFKQAIQYKDIPESYSALGEIAFQKGDIDSALSLYTKSKTTNNSPFVLFNLFNLYSYTGDSKKLKSVYNQLKKFANEWWLFSFYIQIDEYKSNLTYIDYRYWDIMYNIEKRSYYKYFSFIIKPIKLFYIWSRKIVASMQMKIYSYNFLRTLNKKYEKHEYINTLQFIFSGFPILGNRYLEKAKNVHSNIPSMTSYFQLIQVTEFIEQKKYKKAMETIKDMQPLLTVFDKPEYCDLLYMKNSISLKLKMYDDYFNTIATIADIFPGYFTTHYCKVPMQITIEAPKSVKNAILNYLNQKGLSQDNSFSSPFQMIIRYDSYNSTLVLYFNNTAIMRTKTFEMPLHKFLHSDNTIISSLFEF